MKTDALKQALDKWKFDAAFGGARRDEEKSRAKERMLLLPQCAASLGPQDAAPGVLAALSIRAKRPGESLRVFPLSNWTEPMCGITSRAKDIHVVPLYFAKERPVINRDGMLIMVDDERLQAA